MSEDCPRNDYYEPHWEELIDAKNKIKDIIKEEQRVISFAFTHNETLKRNYGMRKPSKNELAKSFKKILDFLERLSMARGKFPGPTYRISDYFSLLEEQVLPFFRDPWLPDKKVDRKFDALNLEKTALKSILRTYGKTLAQIKNHFGPKLWAATNAPSSYSKTSTSSSVIAREAISSEETPSLDSSDGIFTALLQKNLSANRSPQNTRASLDSLNVHNASTVRVIASKDDEDLNQSSSKLRSDDLETNSTSALSDEEEDACQSGASM